MCKSTPSEKKYTLKDIFDQYWSSYLVDKSRKFHLTDYHLKTINTIRCCRTARLGLFKFACISCGQGKQLPRSCKHRFCSTCGMSDTIKWINKISLKLPDIKHHHVVFTLPKQLRGLCKGNKGLMYDLLFHCSQLVLKEAFGDAHSLQPGIISVIHTNGSDLKYHPHVHMIVSCGGLDSNGEIKELGSDYTQLDILKEE